MPLSRIQTTLLSGDDIRWNFLLPSAPTALTATVGNAQVSLTWTAPTGVIAQAPITDYVVQFSSNSGSSWTTFSDGTSTATSATVTGLTNGTAHVFRVAGINGIGTGAYSTASAAVTPSVPPPVTLNSGSGSGTAASKWNQSTSPWPNCDFQGRFITANATVTVLVDSYTQGDSCGCDGENYYTIQHRNASNAVLVNDYNQTFSNRSFTLAAGDYLYIDITCNLRGYRAWVP